MKLDDIFCRHSDVYSSETKYAPNIKVVSNYWLGLSSFIEVESTNENNIRIYMVQACNPSTRKVEAGRMENSEPPWVL